MGLTDSRGDINLRILPPICLYLFKRFRRLSVAMIDSHERLEERKTKGLAQLQKSWKAMEICKEGEREVVKRGKSVEGPRRPNRDGVWWSRVNLQLPVAVAPMNRFLGGFLFHRR